MRVVSLLMNSSPVLNEEEGSKPVQSNVEKGTEYGDD
jgi:hypothetical protein